MAFVATSTSHFVDECQIAGRDGNAGAHSVPIRSNSMKSDLEPVMVVCRVIADDRRGGP